MRGKEKFLVSATPVIQLPRSVPLSRHDKLKCILNCLENDGDVAKVDKPTDWINSLVIVEKKNGFLHFCLDPKDFNKAVKRGTTKYLRQRTGLPH